MGVKKKRLTATFTVVKQVQFVDTELDDFGEQDVLDDALYDMENELEILGYSVCLDSENVEDVK